MLHADLDERRHVHLETRRSLETPDSLLELKCTCLEPIEKKQPRIITHLPPPK